MARCKMLFQQIKEKAVIQPELMGHLLCSVLAASVCLSHNIVNTAKGDSSHITRQLKNCPYPEEKRGKADSCFISVVLTEGNKNSSSL